MTKRPHSTGSTGQGDAVAPQKVPAPIRGAMGAKPVRIWVSAARCERARACEGHNFHPKAYAGRPFLALKVVDAALNI